MSVGARESAQKLRCRDKRFLRSSVSRAYYAAYCAVTHLLVQKNLRFPGGRANPPHRELANYVINNLDSVNLQDRRIIGKLLRRLYIARIVADYRPTVTINDAIALSALRDASRILQKLGVE